MASKADTERKNAKIDAIIDRINDMDSNMYLLLGMLDEGKLDLLILALGLGSVELEGESN